MSITLLSSRFVPWNWWFQSLCSTHSSFMWHYLHMSSLWLEIFRLQTTMFVSNLITTREQPGRSLVSSLIFAQFMLAANLSTIHHFSETRTMPVKGYASACTYNHNINWAIIIISHSSQRQLYNAGFILSESTILRTAWFLSIVASWI